MEKRIKATVTGFNQYIAMGLTNPAAVVWELMPLSFVGDWILPVSSYLEALNFSNATTANYVITTFVRNRTTSQEGAEVTGNGGQYRMDFLREHIDVKREVSTSLPVPMPTWKSALATESPFKRALDAVALVWSRSR